MKKRIIDLNEAPVFEGSLGKGSELAYKMIKDNLLTNNNLSFVDYDQKNNILLPRINCYEAKNINEVMTKCENIRIDVLESLKNCHFPIIIGGDHSVAMASIAAGSEMVGIDNYAVVYIDAHADINTEGTSLTHNIHGMPLASSLGLCHDSLNVGPLKTKLRGSNIFLIGQRSVDELEYDIIKKHNVNIFENNGINNQNLVQILDSIANIICKKKVYISFDVDALDPTVFSSTGYLIKNGMSLDNVVFILEYALKKFDVISMDIVEYNPLLDLDKKDIKTLLTIIEKIISLLSKL